MKAFLAIVILLAVALFFTNPELEDFEEFVEEYAEEQIREKTGDSPLGRVLSDLSGSFSGIFTGQMTSRTDYFLFSTYTIGLNSSDNENDEVWKVLGIGTTFIPLSEPASLEGL